MSVQRLFPVLALFGPLLVAVAVADDANPPKGDLAKFQGKWTTTVGPEMELKLRIQIQANTVTASGRLPNGDEVQIKGEFALDEAAKPFKTVDWLKFTGSDGDEIPTNKGIYEIVDADTIKLHNGGPGNDRPASFDAPAGDGSKAVILKRDKD